MKRKIAGYWLLFLIASQIAAQGNVDQIREHFLDAWSNMVLVAAHRAAHLQYPENSIPAIEEAIRLGVDIVELDVKVTKDQVPVLMHDRTINRTTNGTGEPSDYTLRELKKFRLMLNGELTNYQVPTLEEALKITKGHIMVDIDLKTDQLDPILDVIARSGCMEQVFFFDNDYEALGYIQKKDRRFMLMPRAYSLQMADSAIQLFQPVAIHIDFKFYSTKVTDHIKSANARVWINALGKYDAELTEGKEDEVLDKLLKYGANIIQTDQPELLLNALKKRNLHQ